MRVVISLAGEGTRFRDAGYQMIKPLIPVCGKPIVHHLLSAFPKEWPKIFICTHEQAQDVGLRHALNKFAPGCEILSISKHGKGPVWSVLEGLHLAPQFFPEAQPILVSYCDFGFCWDPQAFFRFTTDTRCDGAVLCYTGYHPEYVRSTMYAYCRQNAGRLLEIREKGHFTPDRSQEYASSGSYYFKSGALMKKYFLRAMDEGPFFNGEAYVSIAYTPMIRDGLDLRVFEIPYFIQLGTPEDVKDFQIWSAFFSKFQWDKPLRENAEDLELELRRPVIPEEFNYWHSYFRDLCRGHLRSATDQPPDGSNQN